MTNQTIIDLLYIDADILIVNKPSGLRTIPDGYDPSLPCLKEMLSKEYEKVWVVHRLDKETSGVILFARNADAHRNLNMQFEKHKIRKVYLAVVYGVPCWDEKSICCPLRKDGDRSHRTMIDFKNGKTAITHLTVIKKSTDRTLFAIEIETGITHQIRAHLSSIGFPIIGDTLYAPYKDIGGQENVIPIRPLLLHAFSIDFIHPRTTDCTHIEALLPSYFHQALKSL